MANSAYGDADLVGSIDEPRLEMDGLRHWGDHRSGQQRLGVRRSGSIEFLAGNEQDEAFKDVVVWMRGHLERLGSSLIRASSA